MEQTPWFSELNKKEAKELLQKWREENTRCSEKILDLWKNFDLDKYLADEKWQVLEQVCIAAMDLKDGEVIKECLAELDSKFPNSVRVARLKAMAKLELRERYTEAVRVYDGLIKRDESNSLLYKRKIAILLAERKTTEAIKELTEYLKLFMNDQEAWCELCELYIQEQEYSKAAFCMEELILTNPHNHLYHERFAEIQYTINTPESIELSKAYFAQAVRLNSTNLRALYGLVLSASVLSTIPKFSSQKRKENLRMASWATSQITKLYKEKIDDENKINAIEGMISNLQINSTTN